MGLILTSYICTTEPPKFSVGSRTGCCCSRTWPRGSRTRPPTQNFTAIIIASYSGKAPAAVIVAAAAAAAAVMAAETMRAQLYCGGDGPGGCSSRVYITRNLFAGLRGIQHF